jgi:hypothetical protein
MKCIAHKEKYGVELRCTREHHHKGRHLWARDDGFYLLGRLDPDNPLDQAIVAAWNKGTRSG